MMIVLVSLNNILQLSMPYKLTEQRAINTVLGWYRKPISLFYFKCMSRDAG
jgi:hypothetical protein